MRLLTRLYGIYLVIIQTSEHFNFNDLIGVRPTGACIFVSTCDLYTGGTMKQLHVRDNYISLSSLVIRSWQIKV